MNQSTQASPPKLQAPGAGLPFSQRVALKLWYGPYVSKRTPRETCRATYEKLTTKLIALVEKVPASQRGTRILVAPIPGVEDSSRFWSLNEVLEHLLIVTRQTEAVILSLASGRTPDGKADPAKVKPLGKGGDQLEEFATYSRALMNRLDEALAAPGMDFNSKLTFLHPWFGPFTARQWYWLLGSHHAIHYTQAKRIARGLGSA